MAKYEVVDGVGIIPEGVTEIERWAFNGCTSLTSVEIPSSVTAIGEYAFKGCTSLTSVVIPSSITKIDRLAFDGCSSLTSIIVEEGNSVYDSREGCNAIIETATNKLIKGSNLTIIPSSVTEIGDFAFEKCSSLTSIVISEGVTSIGGSAFYGCTSLTSVVIPEGVTVIGKAAFKGCTSLKSVVINGKIKKIDCEAFSGCTALESITLPTGVNVITWNAFYGCTSLKVINVPAKKKDYYIQRLQEEFHSLIVEMEPLKKATKKTEKKTEKKTISESTEKTKLSLHVGTAYRLCIFPMDDTICDICDEIFDDEVYNSPLDSICVYFYSYDDAYIEAEGIKYSINNGRKKTLEDRDIIIDSLCDYIDDEETSATTEEIIAEISEDNEDFSLIEKMNMSSEITNPMSKELYKDIKDLHNLRDDDECLDFIVDAIKRRMRQLAEKLINDGLVGDVWDVDDIDDIHFALGFTQLDKTTCSYMIDTNKFDPEKLRTIVCDDCFDCEVSNVLWNGSPNRLLSNIIYDGKFYELCEIKNGKSYTETDIVNCDLQSLE